ncbi:MAG TPA: glycosyltransferase family 4 protein [Gammaproteobacteria bacterium]|nr:glycosyltransferase family 4 protein [Gammaproteobacteria bacterium]
MTAPRVVLHINYGPYHLARLRALARVLPGVEAIAIAGQARVMSWGRWAPAQGSRGGSGMQVHTLFDGALEEIAPRRQLQQVIRRLEELRPASVLVPGYGFAVMRGVARWARRNGVPCVTCADTTWGDRPRLRIREALKGRWCRRHFDAVHVAGERAAAYFARLGFPQGRIWRGYDVVDNDHFANGAQAARSDASRTRARHALPERYFLTVARLSPEKNLSRLLEAWAHYKRLGGEWDLVIVGEGPRRRELETHIAVHGLSHIHLPGTKDYDDLPAVYGLASCLVFPSLSETWGLVVNEAMASGLPVVVSRACGCAPDLCLRGVNGYDFEPTDAEGLARRMLRISRAPEEARRDLGEQSRRIIARWTPQTWAMTVADCLTTVESWRDR